MKKTIVTLTILGASFMALLGIQSCGAVDDLIKIDPLTNVATTKDFVLPASTDTTGASVFSTIDIDSLVKAAGSDAASFSMIKSVKITGIKLTLTDGDATNNFGNFQSAGAIFSSSANSNPYNLAYIENNPDNGATTLTIPVIDADKDLMNYYDKKVTLSYFIGGKLRRRTTKDLHCHADISITYVF